MSLQVLPVHHLHPFKIIIIQHNNSHHRSCIQAAANLQQQPQPQLHITMSLLPIKHRLVRLIIIKHQRVHRRHRMEDTVAPMVIQLLLLLLLLLLHHYLPPLMVVAAVVEPMVDTLEAAMAVVDPVWTTINTTRKRRENSTTRRRRPRRPFYSLEFFYCWPSMVSS
jgi:hypothetical protein